MERKPAQSSGLAINAILFFGFGIAAGILMAFSGFGFLQESAALIATVFLAALLVVLLLGVILFAARRMIWSRLFGFAEVQIEELARPLAGVAERAIAGDPAGATTAARDLVALALARYSWVTTRRWIIASLTALIAAMAALAGTALLFQQNQLLATQSGLLVEQNARIAEQSVLLAQDVQLAEAARNAQLAVEITQIAAELGLLVDRLTRAYEAETDTQLDGPLNVLFPDELPRDLVLRITSVSRATKPYRFLDLGERPQIGRDRIRVAVSRRKDELPNTYARLAGYYGWTDPDPAVRLKDRPASPERGQLLSALMGAGLRSLEMLNYAGLDLSHAYLPNADIVLLTAQAGLLEGADFSGSFVAEVDLGGASLENARFRGAVITGSSFAPVPEGKVRAPYPQAMAPISTRASGTDFAGAVILDTTFSGTILQAANFDDGLLIGVDFTDATLDLATFRGAIVMDPVWAGANLAATDFDGAVLLGDDPLADLAKAALPGSFDASRFRADAVDLAPLLQRSAVDQMRLADRIATRSGSQKAWRIVRVQPFDDGAAP